MSAHRVLVIEDEDGARRALQSLLGEDGFDVRTAATGRGGLREARAFQPDTVVCDFYLPDIDGLQVLRVLRAEQPGATLIVLTAGCGGIDMERAVRREADFFLAKPLDVAGFRALLLRLAGSALVQAARSA